MSSPAVLAMDGIAAGPPAVVVGEAVADFDGVDAVLEVGPLVRAVWVSVAHPATARTPAMDSRAVLRLMPSGVEVLPGTVLSEWVTSSGRSSVTRGSVAGDSESGRRGPSPARGLLGRLRA